MSKKSAFNKGTVAKPAGPFCWLTRDLLESPAWRARGIHCARFLEFLMHEHLSHGGQENGELVAPYAQLVAWGIGKRYIKDAIAEAESLRLVVARRGGLRAHTRAAMTRFRLTFYHSTWTDEHGHPVYSSPGDEWRAVTAETARKALQNRPARNQKKKNAGAHGVTTTGDMVEPLPVHTVEPPQKLGTAEIRHF